MNTSLEIVAKLNDILPNPGCVYEALEPILESCHTPERLDERTWLGIRLSICEFQAANVKYPSICSERGSLSACTQLLETKATWWTTFSGNYRHISAICLEYQPHFESQKVLGTFRDASQLFAEYQSEVDRVLRDYQQEKSGTMEQWQLQAKELAGSLADIVLGLSNLSQLLQNASHNANDILAPLALAVDSVEMKLNHAVISSQLLADQSYQVSRQAVAFNAVMIDVESRQVHATERLQTAVNNSVLTLDKEIHSLQSALAGFKVVLGLFGVMFRFFWPFFAISLVISIILVLRRLQRRNKMNFTDFADLDDNDLVFY